MRQAYRLGRMGQTQYSGLTIGSPAGPVWTGEIRLATPEQLSRPMGCKRGRRIFVDSMSDLFHDNVPDAHIEKVFAVMAICRQHTFQVLTKRPQRMRDFLHGEPRPGIFRWINALLDDDGDIGALITLPGWPLPNVWLGVSVEDQARADQRVPELLATPAAVRFLSCEPMLGPIDLTPIADDIYQRPSEWYGPTGFDPTGSQPPQDRRRGWFPKIDWLIAGGESGPNRRTVSADWLRSLRDQCAAAGVPYFAKQLDKVTPLPADLQQREFPSR